MWEKLDLRARILGVLTVLMFLSLLGGAVMIWYTYRIEKVLLDMTEKSLTAYQSAEALTIALVNQKGFVSYYFMDGDPDWLRQLGEYRQIFKERLQEAKLFSADNAEDAETIAAIEKESLSFIRAQDVVISHYEAGQHEAGAALHYQTRKRFFRILELCSYYREMHKSKILRLEKDNRIQAHRLRLISASGMMVVLLLGVGLAIILVSGVLTPIGKLAAAAGRKKEPFKTGDVVQNLRHSVHGLLQDFDQTTTRLEQSRAHLLQAEKMAMLGKLAAGMAHSIRNPFTSVQMRLFSLQRSLDLNRMEKEDFAVISEEIRHIDTIVQNFLEFSRAPKMEYQMVSPSTIVDNALQLLKHRLNSYDVEVELIRRETLPEVQADPERVKEVLVNIIINACEAMAPGGRITVREEIRELPSGRTAVICLGDNGPGIPDSVRDKLFVPFFTTKEEGTGLGLSIVNRIITEHQGTVEVISGEDRGATFVVQLPVPVARKGGCS